MNRRAALYSALLLGLGVLALAGCGSDNGTEPQPDDWYRSIAIATTADTLRIGQTLAFTAEVVDTAGNPVASPRLTWTSSDPGAASVDGAGRVTGLREGTTVIVATGGHVVSNAETLVVVQGLGWVDQTQGALTLNNLNGVHFIDTLRGWAVGDLGVVLFTDDGGLTWVKQNSQSTGYRLNSVFFTSPQRGFVVGSAGRILETTSHGTTWIPRLGIDTSSRELRDVFFLGPDLGFIVGDQGVLLRTDDGGTNWTRVPSGATSRALWSVWATAAPGPDTLAWAVGDNGSVIGSRDAGRTWYLYTPSVTVQNLRAVVRLSRTQALATGFQNTVAATAASADTAVWALAPAPADFSTFWGLAWPSAGRAYAVGANSAGRANVLLSVDGGLSWTTQDLVSSGGPVAGNALRSVWFVDDFRGWAVGEQGLILHTATGGAP